MENIIKNTAGQTIQLFHLPRYEELPDTGLYLEQTVTYINHCLSPLGCIEVTGSMVRNYVKKGLVNNPIQKQYHADQIAHLICITILKHVISLEHIQELFSRQQKIYTDITAYNYFCMELENILFYRSGLKDSLDDIGSTFSLEKEMLRSAITAVSHIIFLNICFESLKDR
ncbi:MAG: DUF1836 domain-containing protein [Ruminococcus sp.]|nr:DUF1836 domain-containing protein [Ruminococcus sp.]